MPRTRTTKKLAQRIDMNYFTRPHPLRRWRFRLSVALPVLAALWLGWHAVRGDARPYLSGGLSPAHALLTARCETCHVRSGSEFSAGASDAACLTCHDGPPHHATAAFTPSCASCHVEHRGAVRLAATADATCTQCHADLHTSGGPTTFVSNISSFATQHPEFAVLRAGGPDPNGIKLNHYRHMQPNLAGPSGAGPQGSVQLICQDCHRTPADTRAWPYASGAPAAGIAAGNGAISNSTTGNSLLAPGPSAAYMAAPAYAQACAACHTLEFDRRFSEGVPHDKPEVIHAFLVQKFQAYIAVHPAELREPRQPGRDIAGKPIPPEYRILMPTQWVAEHTGEAEQLLWRKTCNQCHILDWAEGATLPAIRPSSLTVRFMPHARFDHAAHQGLTCASCHASAATSQESADLLLPGIATCQQCHRPEEQAAESRCFECHTYHDGSKRQAVPGRFTLPELTDRMARPSPVGSRRGNY